MTNKKQGKTADRISIFIFILLICTFPLVSFLKEDKDFSDQENRILASQPVLTAEAVFNGSYGKNFENYVQDQLAGRDGLVALKTTGDRVIGKHDNGSVYFGKEGMLFAIETIETDQLLKNTDYVNIFSERLKKIYALDVSFMVVPTATEIEKDLLPKNAPVPDESAAIKTVKENFTGRFCDVTENLLTHRNEYIYYRSDHHWTTIGAYYAYRQYAAEILEGRQENTFDYNTFLPPQQAGYEVKAVSSSFLGTNDSKAPGIGTKMDTIFVIEKSGEEAEENFSMYIADSSFTSERTMESIYDESFLAKKDQYSYFLSGNNPVTVIEKAVDEKKRTEETGSNPESVKNLLVIKDSYANCFIPFLTADFDRIVAVDLRYFRKSPDELIEKYKITDVLILYNILNFAADKNLIYLAK